VADDDTPAGEAPPSFERPERPSTPWLTIASGLFALITGVLLRVAVGKQDDTDWNATVRVFLEIFPLVLMVGGVLLFAAAVAASRGPTDHA
jgi:hypothetical protein